MKNNYRTAIIIGLLISIWTLLANAINPAAFGMDTPYTTIPNWDKRTSFNVEIPTLTLGLEFQAVLLRFSAMLIENGFWYFVIPIGLSCAFVKLSDIGRTNFVARLAVRSIKLTGVVLGILWLLAIILCSIYMADGTTLQVLIPLLIMVTAWLVCFVFHNSFGMLISPIWAVCCLIEWWRLSREWKTLREHKPEDIHGVERLR